MPESKAVQVSDTTASTDTPKPTTTSAPPSETATAPPATAAAAANTANSQSAAQKMQFTDFQNILGNLAQSSLGGKSSDLDLSEVLTLDVMAPILSNKEIQARLIEHLPESDILPKNEHELRQTLTTPQFKKAMSSFCMALQSGQLGPLFKQFDLPDEVSNAAAQGNLEAFAKAMEAHAKQKKVQPKKTEEDETMDTK